MIAFDSAWKVPDADRAKLSRPRLPTLAAPIASTPGNASTGPANSWLSTSPQPVVLTTATPREPSWDGPPPGDKKEWLTGAVRLR